MRSKHFKFVLASLLTSPAFGVGCDGPKGDYSLVELGKAQGTVTLDGQPLEGAVVRFIDQGDETFSYGLTDRSGRYSLRFDSEMEGVKLGRKTVRISVSESVLGANVAAGEEGGDPDAKPKQKDLIPSRYNEASELVCDVVQGTNQFDFALVSH